MNINFDINLTEAIKLARSPRLWLGAGLVFGGLLLILFFSFASRLPQSTPPVQPENIWRGLKPGESTREEVRAVLGEPLLAKEEGNYQIESYPGETQFSRHLAFYEGDWAVLLKERIADPRGGQLNESLARFGDRYLSLFGPLSSAGLTYYSYLERGILLAADPIGGTIAEIWYFVPSTREEFLSGPGFELSTTEFIHEEEPLE